MSLWWRIAFIDSMKYCLKALKALIGTTTCVGICLCNSARAEIVYDNATTYQGQMNDSLLESGDEIVLAGTSRLVTTIALEYFAEFTPTGDETARVRFYNMDGAPGDNPFATPGSLLYDSGTFGLQSGFHTINIIDLAVFIPGNKFTFSVEFSGVTEAERAGLLFYDPPTVGASDAYFWQRESGIWSAVVSDGTGNNFAAQVNAVAAPVAQYTIQLRRENGNPAVEIAGATPGKAYTLEYKNAVNDIAWQSGPQARATGSTLTLVDPSAQGVRFRFYRVVEEDLTVARSGNQATVVSFAISGRNYTLQRLSTAVPTWTSIETKTATGNTVTFTVTPSAPDDAFRVIEAE